MKKAQQHQRRQGDVLLNPIATLPEGAQSKPVSGRQIVLAEGEVTGHAHRLIGDVAQWTGSGGKRYVLVREGVTITHEEHDPVPSPVAPGLYEVIQQQEWDLSKQWRRVRD